MRLTFPLMLGVLDASIRPTSQFKVFLTESKLYFPCDGVKETFNTVLGMSTWIVTFSSWKIFLGIEILLLKLYFIKAIVTILPKPALGPIVTSKRPFEPSLNWMLCFT